MKHIFLQTKEMPEKHENDSEDEGPSPVNNGISIRSAKGREIIIILDLATLETVNTKKGEVSLLSCDDHIGVMRKNGRDPSEMRPDIIHQEIMSVLDSPLNKAGKVSLLVHTQKNVLIQVSSLLLSIQIVLID